MNIHHIGAPTHPVMPQTARDIQGGILQAWVLGLLG
jgi:hypothetical protein